MPLEGLFSPGSSGLSLRAGRQAIAFVQSAVASADALVVRRGDHLGLTQAKRRATLEWLLPNGTSYYAGFFSQMPDRRGIGGTEVSVGGYARQATSRWTNEEIAAAFVLRTNQAALVWDAFTTATTLIGWGMWTALSGGTLEYFDFLRTDDDRPVTYPIAAGGRPGIPAGRLGFRL